MEAETEEAIVPQVEQKKKKKSKKNKAKSPETKSEVSTTQSQDPLYALSAVFRTSRLRALLLSLRFRRTDLLVFCSADFAKEALTQGTQLMKDIDSPDWKFVAEKKGVKIYRMFTEVTNAVYSYV